MNKEFRSLHRDIRQFLVGNWMYHSLARGAARLLRFELAKAGVDVFDITWRVKSLPSVIDKLNRKSYESLKDLKDRAGVRVICSYTHEVKLVLEHVSRLFHTQQVENTVERVGLTSFGYASYHCLLKWKPDQSGPMEFGDLPAYMRLDLRDKPIEGEFREKLEKRLAETNKLVKEVSFELQVRTILQHAWASVSHELVYKHDSEVSEITHRRLARLAALLEEVDEVFASEAEESGGSRSKTLGFPSLPVRPVTKVFLKQYSMDVLGIEMSDSEASSALGYVSALGIREIHDFEQLMCAALEALESAMSFVLLSHLRRLWIYLNVLAYWANQAEPVMPPAQQEVMDSYRSLVDEEQFQRVLDRTKRKQR